MSNYGFGNCAIVEGIVGVIRLTRTAHVGANAEGDNHILFVITLMGAEADDTAQPQIINFNHIHRSLLHFFDVIVTNSADCRLLW